MVKVYLVLQIFIAVMVFSKTCVEETFRRIPILVEEADKKEYRYIKNCITPDTLIYEKGKLRKITIHGRNIPSLNKGAFADFAESFSIVVRENKIETVKEEAFLNVPGLTEIDLGENDIELIESNAFYNLSSVELIDLEKNQLRMLLQNTFNNLPNLAILSLQKNQLAYFQQEWFNNTPKLEYLFLSENKISSLPRAAFITISSIERIDLSRNKITHLHKKTFEKLEKLREVHLGYNQLKAIDFNFSWAPNLGFLGIEKNNITFIPTNFLEEIQHALKNLYIHSNPLQCSCLDNLLKWGNQNNIRISFKCKNKNAVCVVPKTTPSQCYERSEEDFCTGCFHEFETECKPMN